MRLKRQTRSVELKRAGRPRAAVFRRIIIGACLGGALLAVAWQCVPPPERWLAPAPATTVIADRDGRPLRVLLAEDGLDRRPIPLSEMGPWIGPAIIAAEDGRFYRHPGVDLLAIGRAFFQNISRGRVFSGASTLSTQVVRLVQPRRRTYAAKAIEALMALKMERALSKDRILEEYLNRAPFGGLCVGVQAAARRYFGCDARDLTLGEAALLAGLPQSPARLRPDRHLDRALRRRDYVLERMARRGFITEEQRAAALAQPIAIERRRYPLEAPHFAEAARAALPRARPGGLWRTTLDSELQRRTEDALRRQVAALAGDGVRGGAAVVIEAETGAVRALVGSPDFTRAPDGLVDATRARRSAGSTLKPLLFALAFDEGRLTPKTVLADVPRVYPDYAPENFDGAFRGLVTARDALLDSLNMPALDLAREIGVARFHRVLLEFGLRTLDRPTASYGLGLALGNGEVTLLDLAGAYATLARGGVTRPLRWFEQNTPPSDGAAVVSEAAAWLVADILGDPERAAPNRGPASEVRAPRMAWKTGTSSGFRDAWTVAWNPEYVVAVWLGNPDGSASPALVGGTAAAPVAVDILSGLYPTGEGPWFARPAEIEEREVCAVSGRACGEHCGARALDWAIAGVSRREVCPVHRRVMRDGEETIAEQWPDEIAAFLARMKADTAARFVAARAPRIVSPRPGAAYRRWTLAGNDQPGLPLIAEAHADERVWWFVDGQLLGASRAGDPLWWSAGPGRHRLVCADAAGRRSGIEIVVE